MNKYKLGEKHKKFELYRVVYLREIPRYGVRKGDIGGWIESERNLSHYGDCVVLDEAIVYDNASVSGNAKIFGDAQIYGKAKIDSNMHINFGCHYVAPTLINRLRSIAK